MKKISILLIIILTIANTSFAQKRKKNKKKNIQIEYIRDTVYVVDTIVKYVEKVHSADTLFAIRNLDSTKLKNIDEAINQFLGESVVDNIHSYAKVSLSKDSLKFNSKIRNISDKELKERFENMYTEIDLPYHPILKKFIARYLDNPKTMNILLGRALYYMPTIEKGLIDNGMPLELKLLPVVESSLRPNAVSGVGAGGLWQFMPFTAKISGLRITSLVDERFDPVKSTEAACKYLKQLYNIYNDWTLAIAAYNCGAGNVNKAIKRAKNAKTYWDIYPYLPFQTRDYVPAFIAANYSFTYYKTHNIDLVDVPEYVVLDTLKINNKVMDLRQISSTLGISDETIKALNPQFKTWIVPAITKEYVINIPKKHVLDFIEKEDEILAKDSLYLPKKLTAKDISKLELRPSIHVVRKGDVLGSIARRYRTTVKKIMRLNNLRNANSLRIGQRLRIS